MILGGHIRELAGGFESRRLRAAFLGTLGLIVFLYPFGIAFVAGGLLPDEYSWAASVVIALNGVVVLLSELRFVPARRAIGAFALLVAILFVAEYIGSHSGFPFGPYAYTDALGLRLAGVPPVIAIAWYGTVLCGWRIVQGAGTRLGIWWSAALAAMLAVALDVVLEPVAAEVERYWLWEGGRVPLQNYVSWFVFTFLAVLLLWSRASGTSAPPSGLVRSAVLIFGMQWGLFVITNLAYSKLVPVLVSGGLLAMAVLLVRLRRGRGPEEVPG